MMRSRRFQVLMMSKEDPLTAPLVDQGDDHLVGEHGHLWGVRILIVVGRSERFVLRFLK